MAQKISRFSVGQSAKFMGLLYLLFGLLFVPFFLLGAMFGPEGSGFTTLFAIALPILYGLMGICGGAIGAVLYNLVAGWVGGLEVELDQA